MTTQEIATKLVALCREGKYDQVYEELFSQDIVSIEPEGGSWDTVVRGMDGIRKKGQQWQEMVEEVISGEVSDPIVAGNFFSCTMKMKVKMKGVPGPTEMDEICVYETQNGKVVKEQFFYTLEPQTV